MALDLVPAGEGQSVTDDDDDVGLTESQVRGLEWLEDNGHEPAKLDESTGRYKWSKDNQVRAYQMMFAGKFGGRQNGAGRPRAAQSLAEYVRNSLQPKMRKALDRALEEKAGPKLNLEAVKLATDIENREARLGLDEHKQDIDEMGKEELLGTFFALLADASTAGQIERAWDAGPEDITVEATTVEADTAANVKDRDNSQESDLSEDSDRRRHSRRSAATRRQRRHAEGNGRGPASSTGTSSPNPYTQAAKRRAANG